MIFLVQFGINKHLQILQRPQSALALRARALLLVFEKGSRAYLFQIALEIMWLPVQIALIQYSGRFKHAWAFSETAKKNFPNHLYNGQPAASCGVSERTLTELRLNRIKNLLCLLCLFNGFITMCKLKKRLIRAAFLLLLQAMFMNDWKHYRKAIKIARETTNNQ